MSVNVGNLDAIAVDARQRISAAADEATLNQLRVDLLGKKGVLTGALRGLGSLPADQRSAAGARANALKTEIDQRLNARRQELEQNRLQGLADSEWVDVTFIPEAAVSRGHLHPLTQALTEITAIFSRLGYEVALGPEVEDDYHNFQALNIPEGHPARDEWDSFYLAQGGWLLRTHTSPVQIRFMEAHQPPIRIIAPGPVYRHEATDAGHESQFHQVEGLLVEEDIRMSDLVGTIEYFSRSMFGAERLTTFHSRNHQSALRSRAVSVRGPAAAVVRVAGSKSWARAWSIHKCSEMAGSTPSATPALLSGWDSTVSPCSSTTSLISAAFGKATCAF